MRVAKSVWFLAAITVVAHLICITQYGYFRDELSYLACGEHLDFGYVDQPPLSGLIAFAIFLPHLIWEVQHNYATVELLNSVAHSHKNAPVTPWSFFAGQIILMDPITFPVWLSGVIWLMRQPRYRALGVTFIALFIEFVAMKGKIYYLGPAYPMLYAAGGIVSERALSIRWRPAVIAAIAAGGAIIAPLAIPILPVNTFIDYQQRLHLAPPRTESSRLGA